MKRVIFLIAAIISMFGITASAEEIYIDEHYNCTYRFDENCVWASGGEYGEDEIKILDGVKTLQVKSFGEYTERKSYYAITENNLLYVWGAHGFYTNKTPASNIERYSYVGGMLALRCNNNVEPITVNTTIEHDSSKYDAETKNQKMPVKILGGVEELIITKSGIFAICTPGDVYAWGNGWGNAINGSPKLLNKNGKKIFETQTSPALNDGRIAVLENDNSLTFYKHGEKDGKTWFYNVIDVCTAMYPESYINAFLILDGDFNVLWESSDGKITRAMNDVHAIEKKDNRIFILKKDGRVYERVYGQSGAENLLTENDGLFETLPIEIYVNGKMIETDTAPYVKNDRTMVPMRFIFEALGAEVTWDNENKTATGKKDETIITMTIGEAEISINGEKKKLDVAPEISNGRTMVPLRAVSEALGADVEWDNETTSVHINITNNHDFTAFVSNAEKAQLYYKAEGKTAKKIIVKDEKTMTRLLKYLANAPLTEVDNTTVWYENEERLTFSVYVKSDFGYNIVYVMVNDSEIYVSFIGDVRRYTTENIREFKKGILEIFD